MTCKAIPPELRDETFLRVKDTCRRALGHGGIHWSETRKWFEDSKLSIPRATSKRKEKK